MITVLKWIAWALLVLPVGFLIGAIAGTAGQAWSLFVFDKLFGE